MFDNETGLFVEGLGELSVRPRSLLPRRALSGQTLWAITDDNPEHHQDATD